MLYIEKHKKIKEISEFQEVIKSVDPYDICNYIVSLDTESWVPVCYWSRAIKDTKKRIEDFMDPHYGEMMWAIYSYLVHNEILIIEDEYYGCNSSRVDKYKKRDSYDSRFENQLYHPIISRLVIEKFLTVLEPVVHGFPRYKMGSSYYRMYNLENLNI